MKDPVIIEVALNGGCKKSRNPNVPISPEEIVADARQCMAAGAISVHNHIEDLTLTGEPAAERYLEAWREIHAIQPGVILCPTITRGDSVAERNSHVEVLARSGLMRLGPLDPGSVNFAGRGSGMPGQGSMVYSHGYADADYIVELLDMLEVAASVSIFDASFLRALLHYRSLGHLRHGALVKLYFGGDYNIIDGTKGAMTFGFRPTYKALEAYLDMLEGTGLAWMVNVYGGDVTACGMTELALERGGHIRVGLEDHAGDRTPTNLQLVEEVANLAVKYGRPIATPQQAAAMIGMRR